MKQLLILIFSLISVFSLRADAGWIMHPNFDGAVERVIDTPEFVYFTSQTIPSNEFHESYMTLGRYDKANDEIMMLSTDNYLSFNTIEAIEYNPEKGYIVIVYSNSDIDLLYDDGSVEYIPAYRLATIDRQKNVNQITFDPDNSRIYIATDFGYVALNDNKYEIAESRNYGDILKSVAKVGDKFFVLKDNDLLMADASSRKTSLDDFSLVETFNNPTAIYPLNNKTLLLIENNRNTKKIIIDGEDVNTSDLTSGTIINIEPTKDGIIISSNSAITFYGKNGSRQRISRHEDDFGISLASLDMKEFWFGRQRRGLSSKKYDNGNWTLTRDYMRPNAPAPFIAQEIAVHPSRGVMLTTYGFNDLFDDSYPNNIPLSLSFNKDGKWKNYGPAYTNEDFIKVMTSPNGFAVDPDNPSLIYFTSRLNGFVRINLEDPDDIIHLSWSGDKSSNLPGFIEFFPEQTVSARNTARLSAPRFDINGNLWMSYTDYNNQNPEKLNLYCWTAQRRRNTTSASNIQLPEKVEIKGYLPDIHDMVVPLKASGNRNILVYAHGDSSKGNVVVIDTNGTPTDTSDDTVVSFDSFTDTDGNIINPRFINTIYEDPSTGLVWMAHKQGVFRFDPKEVLKGNKNVTRIKVSRNDGTNLADYLLNEVPVNGIISDPNGRKWFITNGAGVVCTSSDGREIIAEYNTTNSGLPDDYVYGIAYDPSTSSMMISTREGITQFFLSSGVSSGSNDVKAYPNPVRPDYFGYVTIEGIPSGSLVKITDSAGNVVKELGKAGSSDLNWDVTNKQFKRVASGVYYILASGSDDSSGYSSVGKILVVN